MKIKTCFLTLIIFAFSSYINLSAAIDQTSVERILKENRKFIDFLDVCVTNFASEKKDELFNIYQKHFNAEVAFLQGEYKRAHDYVYDSQKDMVALYEYVLTELYMEDSKEMLDGLAPVIIRSKNNTARQYLTLGYRDRAVARTFYVSGEASYPALYSYKIFKYREGVLYSRRAKRYALLALYTGQELEVKRKIYNQLFKTENGEGRQFFSRFVDKNDEDYIKEMEKTWEDYQKEASADSGEKKGMVTGDEAGKDGVIEPAFESRVEKQVRFRKEQIVARYLINGEFDKAEPIIRTYVEDYNYKLVMATLVHLDSADTHSEAGASSDKKKDYAAMMIHHRDNYLILRQEKSILEELSGQVRVVDDVKKDEEIIETGDEKLKEEPVNGADGKSVEK
jgi:hypothetical protein